MTHRPIMMASKAVLVFFFSLFFLQNVFSQKAFNVTIIADSSIDPGNLRLSCWNGYDKLSLSPVQTGRTMKFVDSFVSKYAAIDISYQTENYSSSSFVFFVNEEPATIYLNIEHKANEPLLACGKTINARSVLDTNANEVYRKMQRHIFACSEAQELSKLWSENRNVVHNDSLAAINRKLQQRLDLRRMEIFRKYPDDYFSYWFFQDQIITGALYFSQSDTAYLKSLITMLKTTFPKAIVESAEGQNLIKRINLQLHPPLHEGAPVKAFALKDLNGKIIKLADFEGKYVMLDFWASWCPPCRKNNPSLKEIYNDYSDRNFEIVSISVDSDLKDWKEAVQKDQLGWINVSDYNTGDNSAALNYNVSTFPHYLLIDTSGKLIVDADYNLNKIKSRLKELFPK